MLSILIIGKRLWGGGGEFDGCLDNFLTIVYSEKHECNHQPGLHKVSSAYKVIGVFYLKSTQ